MNSLQSTIESKEWLRFRAKFDAELVASTGPYQVAMWLGFDRGLPSSTIKARGSWVVQHLQQLYIGTSWLQLRTGLQGVALYDAKSPNNVSQILILLKDHPRITLGSESAARDFEEEILKAIASDPKAKTNPGTTATLSNLFLGASVGSSAVTAALESYALSQRVLQVCWGTLR